MYGNMRQHRLFEGIDWKELEAGKGRPPYVMEPVSIRLGNGIASVVVRFLPFFLHALFCPLLAGRGSRTAFWVVQAP